MTQDIAEGNRLALNIAKQGEIDLDVFRKFDGSVGKASVVIDCVGEVPSREDLQQRDSSYHIKIR